MTAASSSRVVVIGAGHNGLVAAFYLARAGLRPLVLERAGIPGGGAVTREIVPGYRCPALSHELLLWRDIADDMRLRAHGLTSLDGAAELFVPEHDGPAVTLPRDIGRSVDILRTRHPRDGAAYQDLHKLLDDGGRVLASLLQSPPPEIGRPGARDLLTLLAAGRRLRGLGRRDAYALLRCLPMSVADLLHERFESDALKAALAGPAVSGTMLGPRSAGGSLVLLLRHTHRRLAGDALHVRGGPGALIGAMAAAARAAGAEIRTDVTVERIVTKGEQVTAVVADGTAIDAATVLSSVDPRTTFLRLLDPMDLSPEVSWKAGNYRAIGTLAKVNVALAALPAFRGAVGVEVLTGRIHVGRTLDDMERAYDAAKYGEISDEPWLDIRIPSILDDSLAPPGRHVMSIYAHYAPRALRHTTWAQAAPGLLDRVLRSVARVAPGLLELVIAAQIITPADVEREIGCSGGHVFHGELAPDQLFAMRPFLGSGRYRTPLRGLYLCGAGTHPGGFLTGASGRLAARAVMADRR